MEQIINLIVNSFDFGYMFSVNVLAYLLIKVLDTMNGKKVVPVWQKRLIAVLAGVVLGVIIIIFQGFSVQILYSFILSLISWDVLFKPLLKKFKNLDYFKENENDPDFE